MKSESEMFGLVLVCLGIFHSTTQSQVNINVITAQNIHKNIDERFLPCTNFWAHACGNWSSSYVDNFDFVEDSYAKAIAPVLAAGYLKLGIRAPQLMYQMSVYFNACVSYQKNEIKLPQELLTSDSDWTRYMAKTRKYGLNGVFFDQITDVAYNDSLRYVVQLRMPTTPVNLLRTEELDYDSQQLELKLRALHLKYHNEEEPPLYSWSLTELKSQISEIDWETYFEELLDSKLHGWDIFVEVSDVEYFRELGSELKKIGYAGVGLYLRAQLSNVMKKAAPRIRLSFQEKMSFCVHQMRALLPLGMNYIYDRYVYKTRSQDMRQLREIFDNLRNMFVKYLEMNRLQLSVKQLDYVREKLIKLRFKLGNLPDALTSDEFFNNHYSSAIFSSTDFQQNVWQALRLRTFLQHNPLLQRGSAVSVEHYYVNDDVFRARNAPYFEHERNTLTIPLIFIQWPFFDHRQHSVFQYSLMGFILSHEMTHAFEQEGILFDAVGNESPLGLRIRQLPRFQSVLQCALQTPTASLKERIADVNGLQLAYDTFFGLGHDSQKFEYQLYPFDKMFQAPQLFHLNFAQFFCGRLPPAIGHDMDDVRVNEAERNLHQFSIDFKCRAQSHSIDCEMWRPAVTQN